MKMKAIVWTEYGPPDVLQLEEVEKPTPKDDEVLIRIYATTATAGDCEQRRLKLPFWLALPMRAYVGLTRPKRITILGMELAGEIESVGKDVKLFKEGDQVFAATGFVRMGACAEYICLPEESKEGLLAKKPTNMTYEEAASVPVGGLEALHFAGNGNIQSGQKVLINGAGGTIGTFAVQLAKYFGAEVTGVASGRKLNMVRSIGADHVIDYTQEDFTKNGKCYDLILDVKTDRSIFDYRRALSSKGIYVTVGGRSARILQLVFLGSLISMTGSKKLTLIMHKPNKDLNILNELFESGKIKPIIDRCFPLSETAEAFQYFGEGQFKGKVVITVKHHNRT